jgi:ribosomal protein S18 acetylase RimI-like enzyme
VPLLARAFFDDPVFVWAAPDAARRQDMLLVTFTAFTKAAAPYDEVYVAGDAGVALWLPPGGEVMGEEDGEEYGRRVAELAGDDAERLNTLGEVIGEHHPTEPGWFLQFSGVGPDRQNQGIGSALLADMLERLDREGQRAYLDATSPRNKRLYERHGFRAGEPYAVAGGPPLWPMVREPR